MKIAKSSKNDTVPALAPCTCSPSSVSSGDDKSDKKKMMKKKMKMNKKSVVPDMIPDDMISLLNITRGQNRRQRRRRRFNRFRGSLRSNQDDTDSASIIDHDNNNTSTRGGIDISDEEKNIFKRKYSDLIQWIGSATKPPTPHTHIAMKTSDKEKAQISSQMKSLFSAVDAEDYHIKANSTGSTLSKSKNATKTTKKNTRHTKNSTIADNTYK
jgi:hypothetical protein